MNIRPFLFVSVLCLPLSAGAQGTEGTLLDLARMREGVQSRRVSSFDRTGGNNDRFENIPAGERRKLFEVDGAGLINHI